ncbi:MAG TPA: UDP-2,3-diacylglucosamine diphosphatase [Gemmatimonadales bacterium]|nr:UDP-2,3-diacylglucosamine diphosphatase [Gemmatimonadales bacterium]
MRPDVRSIFLSDLHLGLTGCRADLALGFLRATSSERLYLVGDILDLWILRRRVRWDPAYNRLVRHVLKRAQRGEMVVYVPGNHDADLASLAGVGLVNIQVASQVVYDALDGRRLLITHGDEADAIVKAHPLLARLGAHAYDWLIWLNHLNNRARALAGAEPWSFSRAVKASVKRATAYISNFEQVLADRARALGAQGVICGHIHQPVIKSRDGVDYINCGDWIEHCTAVVEQWSGRFELISWTGEPPIESEDDEPGDTGQPAPGVRSTLRERPIAVRY